MLIAVKHCLVTVFSIFTIVRFQNEPCVTSAFNNGTCYTKSDCANRGGVAQGSCASGFGVCCYCKSIFSFIQPSYFKRRFPHSWVYMWKNYIGKWHLLFKSRHTCQNMQLVNQPHQRWHLSSKVAFSIFLCLLKKTLNFCSSRWKLNSTCSTSVIQIKMVNVARISS